MLKLTNLLLALLILSASANGQAAPPDKPSKIHLVSKIVGKDFLSETIRIGDSMETARPMSSSCKTFTGPRNITCPDRGDNAGRRNPVADRHALEG